MTMSVCCWLKFSSFARAVGSLFFILVFLLLSSCFLSWENFVSLPSLSEFCVMTFRKKKTKKKKSSCCETFTLHKTKHAHPHVHTYINNNQTWPQQQRKDLRKSNRSSSIAPDRYAMTLSRASFWRRNPDPPGFFRFFIFLKPSFFFPLARRENRMISRIRLPSLSG